jgi:hypothetical protein
MGPYTIAKIALAAVAAILFGWGIRTDDTTLRWAGVAFLVVALAIRFVQPKGKV